MVSRSIYWDFLRKDRRIPLAITALLCPLIVATLWQAWATLREVNDQRSLPVPTFRRPVQTFPSIAALHLFGRYNENLAHLPPISLQLNLQGIALSITPGDNSSRVLIAVPAKRGNIQAQYAVGYLFYYGIGIQRDPVQAVKWFQRAAKFGNVSAINALQSIQRTAPQAL